MNYRSHQRVQIKKGPWAGRIGTYVRSVTLGGVPKHEVEIVAGRGVKRVVTSSVKRA